MLRPIQPLLKTIQADPAWAAYRQIEQIKTLWSSTVGDIVAAHTKPLRIQRQILQVATSTPTWAQNLSFQRQLILSKLNPNLAQPIKDIRFLPGEWYRSHPTADHPSASFDCMDPSASTVNPSSDQGAWVGSTRLARTLNSPETPIDAFERWAERVKQSQKHLAPCPICGCPTPATELKRWSRCGHCWIQRF